MAVEKKVCRECGEAYYNAGAHWERCRGPRPSGPPPRVPDHLHVDRKPS